MATHERAMPGSIPDRLLEMLACPLCKSRLTHREETGRLHCRHCKKFYPVSNGIPVLLIHEAISEE
jgi:uncharacterized protein YbaR (Trm112 family)